MYCFPLCVNLSSELPLPINAPPLNKVKMTSKSLAGKTKMHPCSPQNQGEGHGRRFSQLISIIVCCCFKSDGFWRWFFLLGVVLTVRFHAKWGPSLQDQCTKEQTTFPCRPALQETARQIQSDIQDVLHARQQFCAQAQPIRGVSAPPSRSTCARPHLTSALIKCVSLTLRENILRRCNTLSNRTCNQASEARVTSVWCLRNWKQQYKLENLRQVPSQL